MLFVLCAATYLALFAMHSVFVLATISAARIAGIAIEKVEFGLGPRLYHCVCSGVLYEVRLIPLVAAVKLLGHGEAPAEHDPPPGSYPAAPAALRVLVALAGPIALTIAGVGLLSIPVALQGAQLGTREAITRLIEPRAVPVLGLYEQAATSDGQWELLRDTAGEYAWRLATFRALPGYGGYLGFIVTTSAVALQSPANWFTCLGMLMVVMGLFSLLPLPSQGGGQACFALWELLTRRRVSSGTQTWLALLGMLPLWVITARMLWLDVTWLMSLWQA